MLVVDAGVEDGDYDTRAIVAEVPHSLVEDFRVPYLGAPCGLVEERHYHGLLFDHHHPVQRPDVNQRADWHVVDDY